MTVPQAISMIRTLLDQSGEEFYPVSEILIALEDAQILKARDYYYTGRKQYIQSLYTTESLTNGVLDPRGDVTHTLSGEPMILETCFIRMYPGEPSPRRWATYMDPNRYVSYLFSNQGNGNTKTGKLHYTLVGNSLRHNGVDDGNGVYAARLIYYYEPTIAALSDSFSLPESTHGQIVDRAAQLLHGKNPTNPDHDAVGSVNDIIEKQ